jgi:hypothetical protein
MTDTTAKVREHYSGPVSPTGSDRRSRRCIGRSETTGDDDGDSIQGLMRTCPSLTRECQFRGAKIESREGALSGPV